ncbi:MAG TPA: hypothetical protein VK638_58965 [Edaphobacter sp.]|nr:hypothetical protein [Edaphobacter sp.]
MLESRFIIMDSYCLNFSVILTRESVGTFYTERLPQTNQGYHAQAGRTPKHDLLN